MIEWKKTEESTGSCENLEDVPEGATVEWMDGFQCMGLCVICGQPVKDYGTTWGSNGGDVAHDRCVKAKK